MMEVIEVDVEGHRYARQPGGRWVKLSQDGSAIHECRKDEKRFLERIMALEAEVKRLREYGR